MAAGAPARGGGGGGGGVSKLAEKRRTTSSNKPSASIALRRPMEANIGVAVGPKASDSSDEAMLAKACARVRFRSNHLFMSAKAEKSESELPVPRSTP